MSYQTGLERVGDREQEDAMLAAIRRNSLHQPVLPAGTQVHADLADLFARHRSLEVERRATARRIAELEAAAHLARRRAEKAAGAALLGEATPAESPTLQEISLEVGELHAKMTAIPHAIAAIEKRTDELRRQHGVEYEAELVQRQAVERELVVGAIDALDAAWRSLSDLAFAREWLHNDQRSVPQSGVRPTFSFASRTPGLDEILATLRDALTTPERAPRRSTDEDGIPVTGWSGYGRLVAGKTAIGDRQQRHPNDALRADQATHAEQLAAAGRSGDETPRALTIRGKRGATLKVDAKP